jgi:hypothetical protein
MDTSEMSPEQIEESARAQGWTPEEEWKGEPPSRGFVSAEEFISAGEKSLPLATKQLAELAEDNEKLKRDMDKLKSQSTRYVEMTNKKMAKDRERITGLINEQKQARAEAISAADGDAVLVAESNIAQLEQESAELATPDPGIQEWIDDNDWYEGDPVLQDLANGISTRLKNERPDLEGKAHLEELSKRVKKAMPDKFKNPKRDSAPPVAPAKRAAPSNGRTFDDLPADAKKAYADFKDMFKSMDKDYTKAEYLANYEWEAE